MPLYNYKCPECENEFDVLLALEKYSPLWVCPDCNAPSSRQLTAPNLSILNNNKKKAMERNEKSIHEPLRVTRQHQCNHSASQHHHDAQKKGVYLQIREGSRPWMLG